ncbi:protein phosphatase CheZ [Pannonibacter carbonis]|uniref:protein phosphatase CheZ n=1 Tax=Pannonibacter carbonis TaxID=2067569 RepID=UPI000D1083AE|nr:protein phosphatase CheZ [Pannonibacter carbonis]
MAAIEPPVLIQETEYTVLEQTLTESDRGRRFLAEYLRRHRSSETNTILDAIGRLERVMHRERTVPDLNRIKLDLADMQEAIERTKREIANIKLEEDDGNRFTNTSSELDAIVTQTERATQDILAAAERIQEQAWILREKGADDAVCDEIDAKATEIFMACSFQDLTGQRTQKVVHVMRYLESRINLMIGIWGISEMKAEDTAGPVDSRPDAHLLNGPQLDGKGVNQTDVDSMMFMSPGSAVDSDDFDMEFSSKGATADNAPKTAAMADVQTSDKQLDAATIDAIFDAPDDDLASEDDEMEGAADDVMDADSIAALFDTIPEGDTDSDPVEEASADAAWEEEEILAEIDEADPLAMLSENERQALFS